MILEFDEVSYSPLEVNIYLIDEWTQAIEGQGTMKARNYIVTDGDYVGGNAYYWDIDSYTDANFYLSLEFYTDEGEDFLLGEYFQIINTDDFESNNNSSNMIFSDGDNYYQTYYSSVGEPIVVGGGMNDQEFIEIELDGTTGNEYYYEQWLWRDSKVDIYIKGTVDDIRIKD